MMHRKLQHGILLLLLLIIWVLVFNKYFHFFNPAPVGKNEGMFTETAGKIPGSGFARDTFSIQKGKRDPFLGKRIKQRETAVKKVKVNKGNRPLKPYRVTENTIWPKIQYLGYIESNTEKKRLALLKINNKLYRIREKESSDDFLVDRIYGDSVMIGYKGQLKLFAK